MTSLRSNSKSIPNYFVFLKTKTSKCFGVTWRSFCMTQIERTHIFLPWILLANYNSSGDGILSYKKKYLIESRLIGKLVRIWRGGVPTQKFFERWKAGVSSTHAYTHHFYRGKKTAKKKHEKNGATKNRTNKYDSKLGIKGTLDDVLKVFIPKKIIPPKPL